MTAALATGYYAYATNADGLMRFSTKRAATRNADKTGIRGVTVYSPTGIAVHTTAGWIKEWITKETTDDHS